MLVFYFIMTIFVKFFINKCGKANFFIKAFGTEAKSQASLFVYEYLLTQG